MQRRRLEDLSVRILIATPPDAEADAAEHSNPGELRLVAYAFDPLSGDPPRPAQDLDPAGDPAASGSVVVLPLADDQMLFVAGADVERITPASGTTLLDRAATEAVAWRQRALRALREKQADERLMTMTYQLNRERTSEGVFDAVVEHAHRVVAGHAAVVLLRGVRPGVEGGVLVTAAPAALLTELPGIPIQPFLPLDGPGVVMADEAEPGRRFAALAPLFHTTGAVSLAHVPLGDKGLLVLVERRADRVLEPEDWDRLDAVARHATAALDRVQLREQTQALSLTDPVTGLGNRRKLEVLLPYHLAAAQRGAPLALAVFELVEDREEMRDASLHLLGECLRRQARGSDILARYGPNSFVALLPNTRAAGAWSLVRRVRSILGQAASARAGVAAYASTASTLGQLLEQARASFGEA